MKNFNLKDLSIDFSIAEKEINAFGSFLNKRILILLISILSGLSIGYFIVFYINGLGLAYNDARSHLDIGRRVVEGLKPGIAQLGSVWLPLNHVLMIPTIWSDFMWHSGLSGAIISMLSYIATGILIYLILNTLNVSIWGRLCAVAVFALNLNVLYLQSTAMTELLLISTSTASAYYLILWSKDDKILNLIKCAFWLMLASLTRYDGWFLFLMTAELVLLQSYFKKGYKAAEGIFVLFCTLGGLGIFLWFLWNQLIFNDAFFFVLGPYSAHAQQQQLDQAGNLVTKSNLIASFKTYFYALFYNNNVFISLLGFLGTVFFIFDRKIKNSFKLPYLSLIAPLLFNVLALFLGFSVLFIQGINGNTWFNARYGILVIPYVAIFTGYLISRLSALKFVLIGLLLFVTFFQFNSFDAVTIDDARVGSSQKNVTEVSGWLNKNAKDREGFILISAASHDAIIFSSGLPMKKFIHEGTGAYWTSATTSPDRWARWIVMRTYDNNDQTYKLVKLSDGFAKYRLVETFPFASIYQLKDEYLKDLNTQPILSKQK